MISYEIPKLPVIFEYNLLSKSNQKDNMSVEGGLSPEKPLGGSTRRKYFLYLAQQQDRKKIMIGR